MERIPEPSWMSMGEDPEPSSGEGVVSPPALRKARKEIDRMDKNWERYTCINNMIKYGGSFVCALGKALMLADEEGRLRFWHFLMPQEDYMKMSSEIVRTETVSLQDYRNSFPEIKLGSE